MATCRRCQGEGKETYDEDGRSVTDVCYHCAGSGQVDEELDFHDQLHAVASTLAYQAESEYRKACDSDPDGDGYELCAAENGLRGYEYFKVRVWERTDKIAAKLAEMDRATQELLVAWNELDQEPWSMSHLPMIPIPVEPIAVALPASSIGDRLEALAEDDIPF